MMLFFSTCPLIHIFVSIGFVTIALLRNLPFFFAQSLMSIQHLNSTMKISQCVKRKIFHSGYFWRHYIIVINILNKIAGITDVARLHQTRHCGFLREPGTHMWFLCVVTVLAESLIFTKPLLSFASSTLRASAQTCSDSTHHSIPFGSMNYRQRACSCSLNILHLRPNTISLHWFYFGNMPWMGLIGLKELQQIVRLIQPLISAALKRPAGQIINV